MGCLRREEWGKGKARKLVTRIIFTLLALHGNHKTPARTARSQYLLREKTKSKGEWNWGHFLARDRKDARVKEWMGKGGS